MKGETAVGLKLIEDLLIVVIKGGTERVNVYTLELSSPRSQMRGLSCSHLPPLRVDLLLKAILCFKVLLGHVHGLLESLLEILGDSTLRILKTCLL